MRKKVKRIFIVISAHGEIYSQLQTCWREWALQNNRDTVTLLVNGNPKVASVHLADELTLITPHEENLIPGVLNKTIDAMAYAVEHYDFDFLIRTNLSSWWKNEDYLENYFSEHLSSSGCYAGFAGLHNKQVFISGAGIILSPDIVNVLLENQQYLDKSLQDDVSIGELMTKRQLAPVHAMQDSRCDVIQFSEQPDEFTADYLAKYAANNPRITHVRLKNPDRRADVSMFRRLLGLQN